MTGSWTYVFTHLLSIVYFKFNQLNVCFVVIFPLERVPFPCLLLIVDIRKRGEGKKGKEKRYFSVVVKKFYDTKKEDHRQAEPLLSSVILYSYINMDFTHKPLPRIAMVLVVASPFIVSCHNF